MSRVISQGYNTLVKSTSVSWAASSTAETSKNIDITLPALLNGSNEYEFLLGNPSTDSEVTAIAKVTWVDSSTTTRYGEIERWSVDAADSLANVIQGSMMSTASRLTLSNVSAASTSGFTVYVQIRAL